MSGLFAHQGQTRKENLLHGEFAKLYHPSSYRPCATLTRRHLVPRRTNVCGIAILRTILSPWKANAQASPAYSVRNPLKTRS